LNSDPLLRVFIAVALDPAVRQQVEGLISRLRPQAASLRWCKPENLHFTLAFLGEMSSQQAEVAATVTRSVTAGWKPFGLKLGGVGVFPPHGHPRVLWVGASAGAEEFVRLQADLARGLRQAGFELEHRDFSPHLTLARVPDAEKAWKAESLLAGAPSLSVEQRVNALNVMRSQLTPAGAVYSILHACPFQT
jgi:RNA 2',3'-cyclic 3'-phosphodiesterase